MRIFSWLNFRKKSPWPWYQKLRAPSRKTPLGEVEFVALDMEMSGLDGRRDRILSIAAVKCKGSNIALSEMFYVELAQPTIRPESAAIHELLPNTGIAESEALEALARFVELRPLVGHFVRLDRAFLTEGFKRLGVRLRNRFIDTSALLPRFDDHFHPNAHPSKSDWKLENLCKRYRLPSDDMHHATGDAYATALLFIHIRRGLEKRGVRKLGELG
jgi:DNA polymerase-3 subunit epsilon